MLEKKLKEVPENPGVYLMKNDAGVIYVGKAKNLKKRVLSYFSREHTDNKTLELVKNIKDFEIILCNSEADALILENNLIKKYSPKYNIMLKDQKTYPYFKISRETFPALKTVRRTNELNEKEGIYFGPYPNGVYNLRKALLRIFRVRDCSRDMSKTYPKPCLKYYMHFCSAPCTIKDQVEDYSERVDGIKKVLKGNGEEYIKKLQEKMELASTEMRFEEAIVLRNQISELKNSVINQVTEYSKGIDEDYFTYEISGEYLFITVLNCRDGKILGRESMSVSLKGKIYDSIHEMIITSYYEKFTPPKTIVFQQKVEEVKNILEIWFEHKTGKKIFIEIPKIKSRKKELLSMAELNLARDMELYFKRKEIVEDGLKQIYSVLNLKNFPRRIECFDISNIQGKDAVASMSVAIEGITKNSEYRKFKITTKDTPDDFAMMREVITRRYGKIKEEELPDTILIDGGLGQINAVGGILDEIGILDKVDLLSIAKKEEEIFVFGNSTSFRFPKNGEAIKIFQRVRDEAHRFGVTYHRKLRSKRVISSELDNIPGLGPKRKEALIKKFGQIQKIYSADLTELEKIVPKNVALSIKSYKKHKIN